MSSDGSWVRHENKAFELFHINLSVNEKLSIWFSQPDLEKTVGHMVWEHVMGSRWDQGLL